MEDRAVLARALMAGLLGFVLKGFAYNVLPFVIVPTFAAAVMAYIIILGPDLPMLEYLAEMLPFDLFSDTSLDESDVMRIYTQITMGLFLASMAGKGLLWGLKELARRLSGSKTEEEASEQSRPIREALRTGVRRLVISSVLIAVVYVTVFIALPFAPLGEEESLVAFYGVMAFFFVMVLVLNLFFVALDSCTDYMIWWAISNVTGWLVWRRGRS